VHCTSFPITQLEQLAVSWTWMMCRCGGQQVTTAVSTTTAGEAPCGALQLNSIQKLALLLLLLLLLRCACCPGALCRSYNADLLYEPWTVLDSNGEPFTTFTSFWQQ
jgi:hypothetical protein